LVLLTVSLAGAAYGCTISVTPPSFTDQAQTDPQPTATASGASADAGSGVTPAPSYPNVIPPAWEGGGYASPDSGALPLATCSASSLHEVEPNDSPDTANVLTAPWVICGNVGPGEVDYITFSAPAAPAVLSSLSWAGSWQGESSATTPTFTLYAGGVEVPSGTQPPLIQGGTYLFKVVGGGAAASYVISVAMTAAGVNH
jgi:hypothetical protein